MIPRIGYNDSHMFSVKQGPHEFFYSYNTLVAYSGPLGSVRIASPSRTTSKHLSKMQVSDYDTLPQADLETFVVSSMREYEEKD